MRYIVGHVSLMENELRLEEVEAANECEAFWKHSQLQSPDWNTASIETFGMNSAELQEWGFDYDMLVSVLELS